MFADLGLNLEGANAGDTHILLAKSVVDVPLSTFVAPREETVPALGLRARWEVSWHFTAVLARMEGKGERGLGMGRVREAVGGLHHQVLCRASG